MPDIHADVGNHDEVTMRNRILEISGILSQNSCILFDMDGLWRRFACDSKAQEYGFQVIHVSDEMALRFNHEKAQISKSYTKLLLIIDDPAIYVPIDIARMYYIVRLSLSTAFPNLSAEALQELPGIDFDWLSASIKHLPFGELDKAQTLAWCRKGMYQAENCREYGRSLLMTAQNRAQAASSYKDWDIVAKCYGKAAMIQHSGVSLPEWHESRRAIEEAFVSWVNQKYKMLSGTVDRKRPVLLSKTADFIRRAADKVALVVMDGMSFENLFTIQREFADRDFSFSTNASFSFFPTVTAVARQSVFSGKLPSEHAKPFSLDNEERQWIEFWKNEGFAESEVFFHKGIVDALPANTKVAGIVVNIVDDLMHSELQGFLGIQHGLSDWVQNGSLATMLRMFIDNGYTVFMTSDHGNTSAIAKGRFSKPSVLVESASRRAVLYDASFDARELDKFDVIRYSGTYLPEGFVAYMFNADSCYGDSGKEYITHGGMTLEEAVVPFVRIGGRNG